MRFFNINIIITFFKIFYYRNFLIYLYIINFIVYALNRIVKIINKSEKYILLYYENEFIFYFYNLIKKRLFALTIHISSKIFYIL